MTTVYFLPGMMCDRQLWEGVWQHLPADWELQYIPIETADDRDGMKALIGAALARRRGHLAGFSMGGYLALEYALEHPQAFASLTMVGASCFGLPAEERERRERHIPMLEQGAYKGISRHRIAQFVHPDKVDDPAVGGVVRAMDARLGKHTLIRQIRGVSARESYLAELPSLAPPTQLVGAEDDRIINPQSLRLMEERIPDARLALLPDTGHMIPLERPAELAALLKSFIVAL